MDCLVAYEKARSKQRDPEAAKSQAFAHLRAGRGVNKPRGENFEKTSGSSGRTRTCNPPVNSRMLYQLSY
jgi:hypothetical protein